jgi:hypothetical protein
MWQEIFFLHSEIWGELGELNKGYRTDVSLSYWLSSSQNRLELHVSDFPKGYLPSLRTMAPLAAATIVAVALEL